MSGRALPRPERSYLVCATQRSGSTLLCETLKTVGVAGCPDEFFEARAHSGVPRSPREYFEEARDLDLSELLPESSAGGEFPPYSDIRRIEDYREHLERSLRHGTGDNGVFGAKIMWSHLEDFVPLARRLPELDRPGTAAVLEAAFPGLRYIWVRREDNVRQAVSLWRAMQTQAWRAGSGGRDHEPEYSFEALRHLVAMLDSHDCAWRGFWSQAGIEPLELSYENFEADARPAVAAVLRHLGLDASAADVVEPATERQADELSEEWAKRFRRESLTKAAS